ncbi:uncharacterized protein LOC129949142 [Eupeodes corollae]|uniref:uncharacterized protein LOC129949142 n=1 Tax=Eupeodes corollae TaxID=290404 RepID=UPI002491FE2A|nr:uncharacterized protein LOC129949142 [Eupeodes corollae]
MIGGGVAAGAADVAAGGLSAVAAPTYVGGVPPNFSIEFFDETKSKFERWLQRLEGAFTIFNVKDSVMRLNYLLHYIGPNTFDLLCDGISPAVPETKTYDELVNVLKEHYNPQPLEVAEYYKFHHREQLEGESVREYVASLRKMAIHCNFGTYLTIALRNQLVCGIRDKRIKDLLLETKDLTFERAIQIATSLEMSQQNSTQLNETAIHKSSVHSINFHKKDRNAKIQSNQTTRNNNNQHSSEKLHVSNFNKGQSQKQIHCFRCDGPHLANNCSHINTICNFCKIRGHLSKVCFKKQKKNKKNGTVNHLEDDCELISEEPIVYINTICESNDCTKKMWINVYIENKLIKMEIDSGAGVSVISYNEFCKNFSDIPIKSVVEVVVAPQNLKIEKSLQLYVVESNKNALFGREWLYAFNGLPLTEIFREERDTKNENFSYLPPQLSILIQKYSAIFGEDVGEIKGQPVSIELTPNSKPVFVKHRPVPFALRDSIAEEINNLVAQGILIRVDHSDWATPIVPIVKANGKIRLCGDFKITLNKYMIATEHPLPTIDELFNAMNGGDKFSKVDLRRAYLQWKVREEDQEKLTLSTFLGLFKCTRLWYGLSCAPVKWQKKIEEILAGIEGVGVFIDDICITGPDNETHLARLETVFSRLFSFGLRVNSEKSHYFQDSIEYCGFKIDKDGIHKTASKTEAIVKAPCPTNVSEVRSLLGLVNYYGRFFHNLSEILEPLHALIRKNNKFKWTSECESAFKAIKKEIISDNFLVHYAKDKPLCLSTDASPVGVGAVLSHIYPDGTDRPIQFASQTLSISQRKWSQIDKEAYAIIYGLKKFYQFLFGRHFILFTDHKPLVQIFAADKSLPHMSATRMQHYAIYLQAFNYTIKYKRSEQNGNADAMSRLPISTNDSFKLEESDLFEINQIETLPITAKQIAEETSRDLLLKKKDNVQPFNEDISSRSFSKGERVAIRNYIGKEKWNFGEVNEKTGLLHYNIKLENGKDAFRHVDQIKNAGSQVVDGNPQFPSESSEEQQQLPVPAFVTDRPNPTESDNTLPYVEQQAETGGAIYEEQPDQTLPAVAQSSVTEHVLSLDPVPILTCSPGPPGFELQKNNFPPDHIRPLLKAGQRKKNITRMVRKTAILTDIPEKAAILEERNKVLAKKRTKNAAKKGPRKKQK